MMPLVTKKLLSFMGVAGPMFVTGAVFWLLWQFSQIRHQQTDEFKILQGIQAVTSNQYDLQQQTSANRSKFMGEHFLTQKMIWQLSKGQPVDEPKHPATQP